MRMPRYIFIMSLFLLGSSLQAAEKATLEQIKAAAATQSKYRSTSNLLPVSNEAPKADTEGFRADIGPILTSTCLKCHGPDKQKGKFRIDTLDPDVIHGKDVNRWVEVMGLLTNGEMPPKDEVKMADADRAKVVDWLSGQILVASQVKRSEGGISSFRRMTKYEFNYALQDILGLCQDFGVKLPPETASEDGFRNSSEMLQMTSGQLATYQDIARESLKYATVRGPRPEPRFFSITMDKGGPYYGDWARENLRAIELEIKNGLPPGENEQNHKDNIDAFKGIVRGLENASRQTGPDRGGRGGLAGRGGPGAVVDPERPF